MARRAESQTGDARHQSTWRLVARDVGALQVLIGLGMLLPALVALIYGEIYTAIGCALASALTAGCGALAARKWRDVGDPERRHAMIIAGLGWLVSAIFGAIPLTLTAWITPDSVAQSFVPSGETYRSSLLIFRNPLHALFESMSGFTTTGFTMTVHEPSIGHGLLFYRSLMQWIGGVGVIVLSLAVTPRPRAVGELELYQSETASMKLRPNILGTARAIWKIYAAMTLLVFVWLFVSTLLILPGYGLEPTLFNSVNHAMTGIATGGFSTLDHSIADYESPAMEMVHMVPMILGVIAFPLYYAFVRRRRLLVFWKDPQFRLMIMIFAVMIPTGFVLLVGSPAVDDPARTSAFQMVSALSGTGWSTSDLQQWSAAALLLMALGTMVVGGAAGSTSGGLKLIRAHILIRAAMWRVRKVFLPAEAVIPFRVGEKNLTSQAMQREVADAAVLSFIYLVMMAISMVATVALAGPEFTTAEAIFDSVSAQGTVGLSTGVANPDMHVVLEVMYILQMWTGRLEIFPVIILFGALVSRAMRR